MFVHRDYTGEGVIITVPAGKVSVCLVCSRLQVQIYQVYMSLFVVCFIFWFSVLSLLQYTHDRESAIWVVRDS